MKKYFLILVFLLGCDFSNSEKVKFECLEIPVRNVIMNSGDGSKGIFDNSGEILIALFHDEIMKNIPEYGNKIGKATFDTMLIYPEQYDMDFKSKDILSSYRSDNTYIKKDVYTPYNRLYEYKIQRRWLLVVGQKDSLAWIASCGLSGIKDDIAGCRFDTNIAGYGVDYSLNNENITFHKKYEKFIEEKITEWTVAECEKK